LRLLGLRQRRAKFSGRSWRKDRRKSKKMQWSLLKHGKKRKTSSSESHRRRRKPKLCKLTLRPSTNSSKKTKGFSPSQNDRPKNAKPNYSKKSRKRRTS
jgi:hypothetical protein